MRERAYQHIQQQIMNGQLEAGSDISELQLAHQLGSSRSPIREAMNKLAAEGMLEVSPGGGMTVARVRREDIMELYELREALELYAVTKAVQQPVHAIERERIQKTIDQIGELEAELEASGKLTLNSAQMQRFIAADLGFHALLVSLAHNTRLQKVISETRLLMNIFGLKRLGHDRATLRAIQNYHRSIFDAVLRQDSEAARASLTEHIQVSQKERLAEYDQVKREASLRQYIPSIF